MLKVIVSSLLTTVLIFTLITIGYNILLLFIARGVVVNIILNILAIGGLAFLATLAEEQ